MQVETDCDSIVDSQENVTCRDLLLQAEAKAISFFGLVGGGTALDR